jgi:1-acyl-sn-glycerol-3-phosphate acyltransferase
LGFFDEILDIVKFTNRPIIIFPQGTRVLPNERPPFKKGAARIYEELKIDCQPIAINSGNVWPKRGNKESNREIIISILKPINPGLTKENFIKTLQENIYRELDLIN